MTLDEAIQHCIEKFKDESICRECRSEHGQLAVWLSELKVRREMDKNETAGSNNRAK